MKGALAKISNFYHKYEWQTKKFSYQGDKLFGEYIPLLGVQYSTRGVVGVTQHVLTST